MSVHVFTQGSHDREVVLVEADSKEAAMGKIVDQTYKPTVPSTYEGTVKDLFDGDREVSIL